MIRLYFVCMGNYYRSRLAEELARYYAPQLGLELIADSGGLSKIPNPSNPGPIANATVEYLEMLGITPKQASRLPKECNSADLERADIVILTDGDEQKHIFDKKFPDFKGKLVAWQARDQHADPLLRTRVVIDKHVQELLQQLAAG